MNSNTKTALTDFDRYLRARYPIIALVSHEEDRVQKELVSLLKGRKRKVYIWTITTGLVFKTPDYSQPLAIEPDMTRDPSQALQAAIDYPRDAGTVFILKDLHKYFNDPVIIRLLRDLAAAYETGNNTLVSLSPEFTTPADLEKNIVVMDWPLPDVDEISRILSSFEANLQDEVPVTLNGSRDQVIEALRGLTAFEAYSVLGSAVIATGELGDGVIPYIVKEKKAIIRKSGALEFYEGSETMDQVGGLPYLKAYANRKLATFSPKAREFGLDPAKGCILLGIPGVGKSLSAKAIAHGMPLLRLDIGAVMGGLVGQSEANIRQALKVAESIAPCVLWIDEIEKALGSQGGETDGGTTDRVKGTILTWMQETKAPVFVLATANDIRTLRPELIRRFDDVLFVDLPNQDDRIEVLVIHLRRRKQNPLNFDLQTIAQECHGFTGAEIEKVVRSALENAFVNNEDLNSTHLLNAAKHIVPIAVTMKEGINELRGWAKTRAIMAGDPIEDVPQNEGRKMIEF